MHPTATSYPVNAYSAPTVALHNSTTLPHEPPKVAKRTYGRKNKDIKWYVSSSNNLRHEFLQLGLTTEELEKTQ